MSTFRAVSPTGSPIAGTLERITGVALISEFSFAPAGDSFDFDWNGETEVDWDSETTVEREGEIVFVDEAGDEWRKSEIALVEVAD